MAILVSSSPLPAQPFVDALRALAPGIPVWSEADDPPAEKVEALLVWRPGNRHGGAVAYPETARAVLGRRRR